MAARWGSPRDDEPQMTREEHCKRLAAECLRLAQACTNPTEQTILLEMAQAWRELADEAARRNE